MRVVRGLRGMSESAMLAVLLGAMGLFFIAQIPGHRRAALLNPDIPVDARLGGALVAVLCIMPLIAYLLAALVSAAARGHISGPDGRLALFWALLAVSPAMLLVGVAEGYLGAGPGLTLARAVAGLGFFWIWGAGLAALWRGR